MRPPRWVGGSRFLRRNYISALKESRRPLAYEIRFGVIRTIRKVSRSKNGFSNGFFLRKVSLYFSHSGVFGGTSLTTPWIYPRVTCKVGPSPLARVSTI